MDTINEVTNPALAVMISPSASAFPGRLTISPQEFATATRTGLKTVYKMLTEKQIPHRRVGRNIVIPLSALDAWFAGEQ